MKPWGMSVDFSAWVAGPEPSWRPEDTQDRLAVAEWSLTVGDFSAHVSGCFYPCEWVTPEQFVVASLDHDSEPCLDIYLRRDLLAWVAEAETWLDNPENQGYDDTTWTYALGESKLETQSTVNAP